MSTQVAAINLAGAIVGNTGQISWKQAAVPPTISQQMSPQKVGATLLVWNDSGCILRCVYPTTQESFTLTAGAWRELHPPAGEVVINYAVTAIFPNATVSFLLADYFAPGEPVDPVGTLGNSPIGLSGSLPTSVTQVINDVNPAVGVVLEATPTTGVNAGVSSAKINNDGSGYFGGNKLLVDNAGIVRQQNGTAVSPTHYWVDQVNNDYGRIDVNVEQLRFYGSYRGGADMLLFEIRLQDAALTAQGGFLAVSGQATAGSFGVPVIVAQALRVSVAVTTLQTILTYSIPANGFYEISGGFFYGNTSAQNVKFYWSWTDSSGTAGAISYFYLPGAGLLGSGASVGGSSGELTLPSETFQANAGTLTVFYQDPGGSPSDRVSVVLKRLA